MLDCEGFYYVFKKLEQIEQYPRFYGDLEKHESAIPAYAEKEVLYFLAFYDFVHIICNYAISLKPADDDF